MPPCSDDLKSIQGRITTLETEVSQIKTAFTVDKELHTPDYHGHRKDHAQKEHSEQAMEEYKMAATKKILTSIAGVVATAAAAFAFQKLATILGG